MKNRGLAGILAGLLLLLGACKSKEPQAHRPEPRTFKASLWELKAQETLELRRFPGVVEARQRAKISSKVGGFLKVLKVREGSVVRQGEILLRIDDREIRARLRALRSALAATQKKLSEVEARLRLARSEFERYRKLFEKEAATQEEFEIRKADYEAWQALRAQTVARLNQVRSQIAETQSLLSYTVLKAPFAGKVVKKWVDEGSFVSPGEALLEMENQALGWQVIFHPEESLKAYLTRDKEIYVRSLQGRLFRVAVTEIVPEIDPQSRTFTVKAALPASEAWTSGAFLEVFVPLKTERALLLPQKALIEREGYKGAYVVDAKGRVHFRVLRLGKKFYAQALGFLPQCLKEPCELYWEILSGLKAGERVVQSPPPGLREGDRVSQGEAS